jgi:hypothetical protein
MPHRFDASGNLLPPEPTPLQACRAQVTALTSALFQAQEAAKALQDENKRLNAALRYEQHRAERIGTHGPGCHAWGPQHYECAMREIEKLRAAPPAREWQSLNEEEISDAVHEADLDWRQGGWNMAFARAIEAKLKEKNT